MKRTSLFLFAIVIALTSPTVTLSQGQLQHGIDSFEAGDFGAAESVFRQIVKANDANSAAYAYLGRIALEREDYDEAVDMLEEAIDLTHDKADYYMWLAEGYVGLIQDANIIKQAYYANKVIGAYEEASAIDPTLIEAQMMVAQFYLQAPSVMGGSLENAKVRAAIVARMDSVSAYPLYAQIAEKEGDTDLAISYYRRGLESDPINPDNHYTFGMFLQNLERWDEALASFDAALEIDADHMASLYQIGRTAVFSKANLPQGIAAMNQYLKVGNYDDNVPSAASAYWRLGMLYEIDGRTEQAKAAFNSALELEPDHSNAKKALKKLGK